MAMSTGASGRKDLYSLFGSVHECFARAYKLVSGDFSHAVMIQGLFSIKARNQANGDIRVSWKWGV